MSSVHDKNEFNDLNFQIWQVKDDQSDKWRNEVYIKGDDETLRTIKNSLQGLLIVFQTYGKGTKKFKCNPPDDFDHISYGKEHGVTIRWLDQLVIRIGLDAIDDEPFILEDFVVSLSVNPNTMKIFIKRLQAYLDSTQPTERNVPAVCGLRFSPVWSGIE